MIMSHYGISVIINVRLYVSQDELKMGDFYGLIQYNHIDHTVHRCVCVCVCLPLLCEVLAGSVPPQLQRFALGLVLRLLSMVLLITASYRAWNAHKDSLILESI